MQDERSWLAAQKCQQHAGVIDDSAGAHATPAWSDPSAELTTLRMRACSSADSSSNAGGAGIVRAVDCCMALALASSSGPKAAAAASSAAICATTAAAT